MKYDITCKNRTKREIEPEIKHFFLSVKVIRKILTSQEMHFRKLLEYVFHWHKRIIRKRNKWNLTQKEVKKILSMMAKEISAPELGKRPRKHWVI